MCKASGLASGAKPAAASTIDQSAGLGRVAVIVGSFTAAMCYALQPLDSPGTIYHDSAVMGALLSWPMVYIAPLAYVCAVMAGCRLMSQRASIKPFLKQYVQPVYNVFQIVMCSYMVWGLAPKVDVLGLNPFAMNTERDKKTEWFMFVHYLSKFVDWTDTFLMIGERRSAARYQLPRNPPLCSTGLQLHIHLRRHASIHGTSRDTPLTRPRRVCREQELSAGVLSAGVPPRHRGHDLGGAAAQGVGRRHLRLGRLHQQRDARVDVRGVPQTRGGPGAARRRLRGEAHLLRRYTHYLVTSLGLHNPLKSQLTNFQLAQFASCVLHAALVFASETVLPARLAYIQLVYHPTLLFLFGFQMKWARRRRRRPRVCRPLRITRGPLSAGAVVDNRTDYHRPRVGGPREEGGLRPGRRRSSPTPTHPAREVVSRGARHHSVAHRGG